MKLLTSFLYHCCQLLFEEIHVNDTLQENYAIKLKIYVKLQQISEKREQQKLYKIQINIYFLIIS